MAEVEYKGIKLGGSKLLLILPLLGTIGGGLWGGFELWHRYQAMEAKIAKYVAPDMSGFDKKLAVLKTEMVNIVAQSRAKVEVISQEFEALRTEVRAFEKLEEGIKQTAEDARDYTKEIKRDLKNELHTMSIQLDSVEKRGKEAFKQVRDSIDTNDTKVRTMITVNSDRFDNRREDLRTQMDELEKKLKSAQAALESRINKTIEKTLRNPLNKLQGGG
jgi:DNA anti-recombination protein RmuC